MNENIIKVNGISFVSGISKKFDTDLFRVKSILEKPEITAADRMELIIIYAPAFHTSGKIEGITSYDSSAHSCTFCNACRKAAENNPAHICGMCYDIAQENYKVNSLNRHSLNMLIMSSVEFTETELSRLSVSKINRINSSGDTPNKTYALNMLRLAKINDFAKFAYWAKNTRDVIAACDEIGKPENMILIQSSIIIGRPAKKAKYFDYVFTVYPTKEMTAAAIETGSNECNGKKCMECGFKCYFGTHAGNNNIAEYLRGVNTEKRKEIVKYLETAGRV